MKVGSSGEALVFKKGIKQKVLEEANLSDYCFAERHCPSSMSDCAPFQRANGGRSAKAFAAFQVASKWWQFR